MTIKVNISKNEYLRLVLLLAARSPLYVLIAIAGIVAIVSLILFIARFDTTIDNPLPFVGVAVVCIVAIPYSIYANAVKIYDNSRVLQGDVDYEFIDGKIICQGTSFNSARYLDNSYKIVEFNEWFCVFETEKLATHIPKKGMNEDEINELRFILKGAKTMKRSAFLQ